jgi:hypothetical protein
MLGSDKLLQVHQELDVLLIKISIENVNATLEEDITKNILKKVMEACRRMRLFYE